MEITGANKTSRLTSCDFFSEVDDILQRMNDEGPDESFESFLGRCCPNASAEANNGLSATWRALMLLILRGSVCIG